MHSASADRALGVGRGPAKPLVRPTLKAPGLTSKPPDSKVWAMVEYLIENFRPIVLGGFLTIIAVSRFHRVIGSLLGLLFIGFMAFVGHQVYAADGQLGLGFMPLSEWGFYGLCAILGLLNVMGLMVGLSRSRARSTG